jgi:CheY-like chemotaxis protein
MSIDHPAILLIEDSPVDVDLTLRAFDRQRLINPVIVARDGEEALAWLPRWAAGEAMPAVILLDLNLPRVNWLTVLQALKSNPLTQCIPVVVLTTSKEERDIETAYRLGANSYIVKPVAFDAFMEVARQINLYWCVLNERPR